MQKVASCTRFAAITMQVPAEAATDAVKSETAAKTRDTPLSQHLCSLQSPVQSAQGLGRMPAKATLGLSPSLPQVLKGK